MEWLGKAKGPWVGKGSGRGGGQGAVGGLEGGSAGLGGPGGFGARVSMGTCGALGWGKTHPYGFNEKRGHQVQPGSLLLIDPRLGGPVYSATFLSDI